MYDFTARRRRSFVLSVLALVLVASPTRTQQPDGAIHPRPTPEKPNLVLFTVGIAKYQRAGNDLFWMDQDARDHCAFWKSQQGRLFREVRALKPLVNKDATGQNIRRGMKEVEDIVKDGDVVIAPWHGHGCDPRESGEWLFCTYDGEYIRAGEIRDWVTRLSRKGARVVLIYSSCHSGAMLDVDVPNVAVLASSVSTEVSWDIDGYLVKGNSLFTRVVFEAFGGKADANGDGVVTLGEAIEYLGKNVPAFGGRRGVEQHPAFRLGGLAPDTPLFKLTSPSSDDFVPPAPLPRGR